MELHIQHDRQSNNVQRGKHNTHTLLEFKNQLYQTILQVYNRAVTSNNKLGQYALQQDDWELLTELRMLLQPFSRATAIVSRGECESTGLTFALYDHLMGKLEAHVKPPAGMRPSSLICQHMAKCAWKKLRKWYSQTDTDILAIAAVLDPRFKLAVFQDNLRWPAHWVDDLRQRVSQQSTAFFWQHQHLQYYKLTGNRGVDS